MRVTNEIVYLTAEDEQEHYITHGGINVDSEGFILDSWVPVRYRGEFLEAAVEKVEFTDVAPRQVVGASASLIPLLQNDMTNRALMGTNMQCQAVPLVRPEAPVVGTGMEEIIPRAMKRVIRATSDDEVVFADAQKVFLKSGKTYFLTKFKRTNPAGACYSQRTIAITGQKVKEGDLLIDGPSCDNGELALGRNLLVAYCSFDGFEYEDAIVISDRLVKEDVLTSIHIEEYEASVVETKLGPEELTRDIPKCF